MASLLFICYMGGALPEKLIPALAGRNVRCILFDLGDTLWSRKDMAVWERVENAANVRAVAILRKCITSPSLPNVNEVTLGKRLRESVDERLRNFIRQEPGLEPHGGLAIVQVLQQWGIEGSDIGIGEAIFEALRVRIPESRPLFDDVHPTLGALRQRGFQLGVVSIGHQALTPAESASGNLPDDLPPGMHITDDDYVLAHIQSRAGKWDQHLHGQIKPDLIIENLSDLLDVFIEVGEQ